MTGAPTSTSTGHVRKRQFQPSIRSYFNPHDSEATGSSSRLTRSISPLSPPVPEETQASLLSVGMRVRKSVPEGYKTHKTLAPEMLPFPSTSPSAVNTTAYTKSTSGHSNELMPFCGLHKTGGWAMQEVPPSSAPAAMQARDFGNLEDDHDDMPGLSTSQSTLPSSSGSFMNSVPASSAPTRKRTYEEEIEDDMDEFFGGLEATQSASSFTVPLDRPTARMRNRTTKASGGAVVHVTGGDDDFEEATFLSPMDVDDGMRGR